MDQSPAVSKLHQRVQDLLEDAQAARQSGDLRLTQTLVNAVLALDPGNKTAKDLAHGSAVRRQMTLLFCDIVGSTQLADDRDPEETSALLGAYRRACSEVIDRFGGFIDDHRGDGMLVLFGYPQVNEDDARRAVSCGHTIVTTLNQRMKSLLHRRDHVPLSVRIAVHTDLVVLDGVGVSGATANEAARIQDHAPPDTVVISDATRALVWPYFETASIGIVALRGVSRPIEIFTVLRERSTPQRSVTASPFVGRELEIAEVQRFLSDQTPLLHVSGQAGVGKTRLVTEALRRNQISVVECQCSRVDQNTSLHVFRALLERICDIDDSDPPEARLTKLRSRVGPAMESSGDLPFLSTALGIPLGVLAPPVAVNPSQLRQTALVAAAGLVRETCAGGQAVLFVDDAHWADQSSLDLIAILAGSPPASLRVVLTARDGLDLPWPPEQVSRIALDPLSRAELKALAEVLPEGMDLPPEDLDELIDRSDGIPLFLEELLRTADAVGRGQIVHRSIRYGEYQIPPALLDPLLARLASPHVDLDLIQIAATIGRDVDRVLLERVYGADVDSFGNRIDVLIAAGLVERSDGGLRFRHELIREVAYESQRRSTRRNNHGLVADAIDSTGPDITNSRRSEMATHLERADRKVEAITAHLHVAGADQAVGAHAEVLTRLTHTLELVDGLPDSPDRVSTELIVRKLRSFSALALKGFGAPEAGDDFSRATEIARRLVDHPEFVPTLLSSWTYFEFVGELDKADEIILSLIADFAAAGQSVGALEACYGVGEFFRGHLDSAAARLETYLASERSNVSDRPPVVLQVPSDSLCAFAAHQSFVRWAQGDPRAASDNIAWARKRIEGLVFPFGSFTACYVDHFVAVIQTLEGDYDGLTRTALQMHTLAERHGFEMWQLTAALHLAISQAARGRNDSIDEIATLIVVCRDVLGARVHLPYWLTQLGRVQDVCDLPSEAVATLSEALAIADQTGCEFYSSETLRIRGKVRLEAGDVDGMTDLISALDLANHQGARALADRVQATIDTATR